MTAIIELVKNAFDADAEVVRIRFARLGTPHSTLVVEDDGCGMSVDDLRNFWLFIGTSNKLKARTSERKRVMTGEKGLGRLGLDRLCSRTQIQSITESASEGVELDIDWTRYEQAETRLETINHRIFSLPNLRRDPITEQWGEYPHGTRLILTSLKEEWDEAALSDLRAELSLLVSPFAGVTDFRIELSSGCGWDTVDGIIRTPEFLLNAAQWKVLATLDERDQMEIVMSSEHRDTEYHFKPTPWREAFRNLGERPHCGPLRFEFYYFPRRETELGEQTLSRSTISAFLDQNQGIRIYRDNFRVKPYGEPDGGGDWLHLAFERMRNPEGVAQRARVGRWRVGYNQLVGAVFISREKNAELLDQTNREGVVEGKAFAHLRALALKVVRFFEVNNQTFEIGQRKARSPQEEAEEKVQSTVEASRGALEKLTKLADDFQKLQQAPQPVSVSPPVLPLEVGKIIAETKETLERAKADLEESSLVLQQERARVAEEKNTMANLASLGILAAAFGHETVERAGNVVKEAEYLRDEVLAKAWWISEAEKYTGVLDDLVSESTKLRSFAKFALGNVTKDKRRKQVFCIKEILLGVLSAFRDSLEGKRRIKLNTTSLPQGRCLISGYPMDWESIFINLITNAVWAMEDTLADARQIRVELQPAETYWVQTFEDSGRGLEAGTEEHIFLPGFTTKRNRQGEEIGTGMGLTIVKSFIEENTGGAITVVAHGPLGGARFLIQVPRIMS